MKVELNWVEGPPTKIGLCLLAIKGSEHAIPASVSRETGLIWSITNPAVKYAPDTIAYHADWPTFPRERDERWVECDRRTWDFMSGKIEAVHRNTTQGKDEYIGEKYAGEMPQGRMEVNMYGHLGARYFRWPSFHDTRTVPEDKE